MAEGERGIGNGPNSHSLDDTVATTGPGIPDDALAAGESLEDALPVPDDASPEQLRERVFGDGADPEEPEAHPS